MTRTESDAAALSDKLSAMSADEAVGLVRCLCARLGAVESFHGNIWPGNIWIDEEGVARLGEASDLPAAERTADQVEYVAPEFFWQSLGDGASDVYSLGLILYVGCSGVLPFQPEDGPVTDHDRAAALQRRLKGEPVEAPGGISPGLGAVIQKALAYEPQERYASPAELMTALGRTDEALPGSPLPIEPESPPAEPVPASAVHVPVRKYTVRKDFEKDAPIPIRRRRRRRFSPVIAALCVAAVAVIGAAGYTLFRPQSTPPVPTPSQPVPESHLLPGFSETADESIDMEAGTPKPSPEAIATPAPSADAAEASRTPEPAGESAPPTSLPSVSPEAVGTLIVTSRVNLRAGPGTDFEILGVADVGTALRSSAVTEDGKWYRVSYNGAQAYVNRKLVKVRDFAEVSAESGSVRVVSAANIRSGPGTDYDILGKAAVGDVFTVTGQTESHWYQILYNGASAYIAGNLVEK